MFINPKEAIAQGWLKLPEHWTPEQVAKAIQPNAIDFTADRMFLINNADTFVISETGKQSRKQTEREAVFQRALNGPGWVVNECDTVDIMSDFYVTVPSGVAAYVITRSTFVRNGLFIQSGLYDSGFSGNVGCVLFNRSGRAVIGKGTRIGQLVFVESDSAKLYAGQYNTSQGEHWQTKVQP